MIILSLSLTDCGRLSLTVFMILFFPQVFAKGADPDSVVLMAAQASRTENQDAIDAAIVGMLADPKEVVFCFSELSLTFLFDTDLC